MQLRDIGRLTLTPLLFGGVLGSSALLASQANADTILGVYAGADYWAASLDGNFGARDSDDFFNSRQSDSDREQHTILSASFEHPIPLIPNIWARYNPIDYAGTADFRNSVQLGGTSFSTTAPTAYSFDLTHTDVGLYYEVLDNWVTLDLGIAAKVLDVEYRVQQNNASYRFADDSIVPMLYGKAAFDLPFSGWQLTTQAMALSFEGDSVEDISAQLGYNLNGFVQFALGYRALLIDVETDDNARSEIDVTGAYANLTLHL